VFGEFTYDWKPFNEESSVVLQVGTKWNKNVERVMEAVAGTGCRLEIVGELREEQRRGHGLARMDADRVRAASPTGLEGNARAVGPTALAAGPPNEKETEQEGHSRFRELGRLTDEELVEAYRRCDMVVFASLYEGFGLPILEAQAMGRPVITSNFGAMREAAGDGALLVDPYSVESIRDAVLRVKNEPLLREELVAKGLRNAERFRAEAIATTYADIYRNLARAERSEP
jgi:glycosyltransferase involved in cell wall biosynthesis